MKTKPITHIVETTVWNAKANRMVPIVVAIEINLATLAFYLGRKAMKNKSHRSKDINGGVTARLLGMDGTASPESARQAGDVTHSTTTSHASDA